MLHELRYGQPRESAAIDVEIVNPAALDNETTRLNLGCGHLPLEGYVNVDMRKLPGVDVVAPLDAMPFESQSVDEIFSAHVLEHFPQAALERQLLPYWYSLLTPGGVFRSVVPDVDAMIDQYRDGSISFENLREVVYGGQEYEGDFHHTAFTPESLSALLVKAGFDEPHLVARGRENGACLEFELTARRPD
jgi:predicted SAM-dependent methyltransferase